MFEVARFEADELAVPNCRHWLARCLEGQVEARTLQDAQLCVSELAANAVRHAATPFRVELTQGAQRLRVAVHDDDPRPPHRLDVDPTSPSGRGLAIIEMLSTDWGWQPVPGDGKEVWFSLLTDR